MVCDLCNVCTVHVQFCFLFIESTHGEIKRYGLLCAVMWRAAYCIPGPLLLSVSSNQGLWPLTFPYPVAAVMSTAAFVILNGHTHTTTSRLVCTRLPLIADLCS
jgi:hypothetical protein